ncbi:peptidoglycan editing factor PgeF [Parerythrobacter aestuarii]|uniref:peptidoglycan editing factor PgeF n=1 Tax=Parerythrobacter aestuarii TaxID=3020909 RepID=UPI0024DE1E8E|nr:peptidoglycan editing factor PgeF [Parerythrobacter aestuarii]
MAGDLEILRAGVLGSIPHGFLTRKGGVSTGEVAGLQFGIGADDDPASVAENRRRAVAAILPESALVMPHQVHSPDAVVVTDPWPQDARPQADAVVTDRPGLLLGVVTADCAPILLADHEAGVVAAAHAGWRGAQAGVLESTIEAMRSLGAQIDRIAAAIGPCIAQASYEVDARFRTHFTAADERFFAPGRSGHWQFDLEAYVEARLMISGVRRIERLGRDTYTDPERFYSFRRATHLGEANYGRQASVIGLANPVA